MIERRMANCWWGEKGNKKQIHWAKWGKLTAGKLQGGLEFRDLRATNEALLAKQVWRLLKEPELLMSQVLKGKYFTHTQFFQAKQRGKDSWLWKSWLSTKDLISKGIRWTVGDGRKIRIWEDNWLPTSSSLKPILNRPSECPLIYVSD